MAWSLKPVFQTSSSPARIPESFLVAEMLGSDAQIQEYVCSERAYVLFQRSARWTVAFWIFFVLAIPASKLATLLGIDSTAFATVVIAFFMVASCVAGLTIFFGMFAYLLLCDQSSPKMLWATVFLLTAWLGCTAYFFKVYRKQMLAAEAIQSLNGR
jgi:hypothetical protein